MSQVQARFCLFVCLFFDTMENPLQKENQYTTRPGGHPTKHEARIKCKPDFGNDHHLHCMWCKNPGNNRGELKERGKTKGFTCT